MKLVDTSVRRPVGVIMIVLAILALGFVSLRSLAIDLFPKIDLPIAVVATNYPDAAPQEVEKQVSQPLEASLSSIEGVETVQSQSQSGSSMVVLMFSTGVDLDNALLEVREQVDSVKGMLPDSANDPSVLRFNPDQMPVMWVGLTGEDTSQLQAVAEDQVVPYFERQGGVASVTVEGGQKREIQLELDQAKLSQYGISTQDISQALGGANQSGSAGAVQKGDKDLQVRVDGDFESVDDIRKTIIQSQSGTKVHIEDIAEVKDTFEESSDTTMVNGSQAVVLSVMKKTDGNTVDVADNVTKAVADLKEGLPSDVSLDVVIDTSAFIKSSINSVVQNMIIGGIFAVLILLLFLKSIRATLVIGLSIPIAVISTFTLLYFTGETLNVLTMGGLALGIGMMVDSSIVILENIVSYRQRGYSIVEAAKKGASELAPAVIASTTTTLVVFLPIVFVEGIASSLFTPFALTVAFALIASLVVSITLIPMLSSKLLTKAMKDNGRRYWFDRFLDRVNNGYKNILRKVLKFRKTTVFATFICIVGSLALVPFIGAEFMPASDQGQIEVSIETPTGTSTEETEAIAAEVSEKLENYQDLLETSFLSIGGSSMMGPGGGGNQASYTLQLISSEDRGQTTDQVVADMQADMEDIVGAEVSVSALGAGMSAGSPIQIQLNGPEHEVLRELSDQVVSIISKVDGVQNPTSSVSETQPELNVTVDREAAAQHGLTHQQVMSQIQMGFTGQVVMNYREDGDDMNVRLTFPEDERSTISDLQNMAIQSPAGSMIPLDTIADFEQIQGPATLARENQQPQVNVTSDISGRDLASISSDVEAELEKLHFPEEYSYSIGGEVEDMTEAFTDLAIALVFSIFLVYAVMAVQFENFLTPLVIMFSLPATVVGILLGLFLTGKPMSITAFIGVIMLAGIVVNNAIVLVDYINILRRRGMDRFEAILEAGASRMRPILMTTLTTILGMVPLALGFGEGAESQQPMAITIIFGLGVSSIFTLLLIPVVYTYFDGLSARVVRLFRRDKKREKQA
ncbi:efflux RND transporter permease subunit [Sediminibacillus albus]|uniref:Hydrophobic/amphiphilic exporter-1, HAE1 family n=1 Tax=Sediminibacillus albus TaxID=407036 RepID=A0A1G8ZHQ3_9BACI|nr:efflux RND transporter permease subunit [Sediminibacillus albus]SDK14533.1 hydrophobic/amphiphilic exporter-1, HAE1 family [Sediminibacillus albus]